MKSINDVFKDYGEHLPENLEKVLNQNGSTLLIPSKVEAKIKYFSKNDLEKVHPKKEVSKDLILLMISFFSNTFTVSNNTDDVYKKQGYKKLSSKILSKLFKVGKASTYKTILDLLLKYDIIEKGRNYSSGNRSNEYKLTKTYFGKGTVIYNIESEMIKNRNLRVNEENLEKVLKCPIAKNELLFKYMLNFPTKEEAKAHLIKLSKEGKTNKKGKPIKLLGKHSKNEYPNCAFIEDYLEILEYLSKVNIPIISSENGGERVITSFNFLPSVLRELVTFGYKKEKLVELDYQTMHPNLVAHRYGGKNQEPITHDKVAEYLGVDRSVAKIGHLSFFNLEWDMMLKSPLFKYYSDNEAQMMENLYYEKTKNGYKETSKSCFEMETTLQRRNITDIRNKGIICFYVFDALYTIESDAKAVRDIMNKNAKKAGYLTQVK